MKPSQRKKKLQAIVKSMGGRYGGRNIENYQRIADITRSSVITVKAWHGGYRNIPELKLEILAKEIVV